ncbi:MAG: amidohydrolase family protein [Actinomycetota bacterium]
MWNDEWLATGTEEAIDAALPIVDPHHHLWDNPTMKRYLVEDLHADTSSGHNVVGTVFVECQWSYRADGEEALRPVGETERVAAVAKTAAGTGTEIRGIVGFADLTLGDGVEEVLDAHVEAGDGRFRGIRHATAIDPDRRIPRAHTRPTAGLMADRAFRAGVARLGARGLRFDAWIYHPQIPELAALARAVPECTFVLDHLGGPLGVGAYLARRAEVLERWRRDMAELATCPNVVVKLGGIGMALLGLGYEHRAVPPSSQDLVDDWGGPVREVIEQFGADRCMFESNFPVDKLSCSYITLWNSFKRMTADASPTEKAALFHDTAVRIYTL